MFATLTACTFRTRIALLAAQPSHAGLATLAYWALRSLDTFARLAALTLQTGFPALPSQSLSAGQPLRSFRTHIALPPFLASLALLALWPGVATFAGNPRCTPFARSSRLSRIALLSWLPTRAKTTGFTGITLLAFLA